MKVAVLAPVAWRTPPRHYGPWEQVASNIAEGLVASGFEVTLFATGDSITSGKLDAVVEQGYEEDRSQDAKVIECLHISNLMEKASSFDIIHNNFDFLPLSFSKLIKTPVITTIHGFSSERIVPVYKKYNETGYYVSISDANRHPDLSYLGTVYNGLDISDFTFNAIPQDYLLFFGRIHPDKGAAEAVEIAEMSGKKLIIAGIIQDENYFKNFIEPKLSNQIQFIGAAGPEKRDELLGNAIALLHPINFAEPFGMSVAESMLCGTPVIAFNKGSMPELIKDGETGFLVTNSEEAVKAVDNLQNINRSACREWAAGKFSKEKMVADYISLYHQIV
ncbi:MAG: glycosyltransferase family 4 protein [Pedobacter sp.]|nr:MAG: glycosyltransferase family 4 protein [Pedobacter sp.]